MSPHAQTGLRLCFFLGVFCHFRAAYGGSQARGPIGAVATTWDLSFICDLHHGSWQHRILNSVSEARDQTLVLMDASRVR